MNVYIDFISGHMPVGMEEPIAGEVLTAKHYPMVKYAGYTSIGRLMQVLQNHGNKEYQIWKAMIIGECEVDNLDRGRILCRSFKMLSRIK